MYVICNLNFATDHLDTFSWQIWLLNTSCWHGKYCVYYYHLSVWMSYILLFSSFFLSTTTSALTSLRRRIRKMKKKPAVGEDIFNHLIPFNHHNFTYSFVYLIFMYDKSVFSSWVVVEFLCKSWMQSFSPHYSSRKCTKPFPLSHMHRNMEFMLLVCKFVTPVLQSSLV